MSYTYTQIQARIADELHRTDLTSPIQKAIISAIEHYERERFWFGEVLDTNSLTCTIAQNYVAVPTNLVAIDKLQLTVGGSKYTLEPIGYEDWANRTATSTTSGQPTKYCYYADKLYLFPTPGTAYALTISYVKKLTALSAGTDTNGWTNFAEELIRQRAVADLRINQIQENTALQQCIAFSARGEQFLSAAEKVAYLRLKSDNDTRVQVGKVKARYL